MMPFDMPQERLPRPAPLHLWAACPPSGKLAVLVALLKAIREGDASDKVVLVSNYTESLALCDKVGWARGVRG
jgi:hypothetical protein